jgi:hypothetical protein
MKRDKTPWLKILIILVLIFVYLILQLKRNSTYFLVQKIQEGLQNFDSPILNPDDFLEDNLKTSNTEYGTDSGRFDTSRFSNVDEYKASEVAQDIKYFNNASSIIIGMKLNDGLYA